MAKKTNATSVSEHRHRAKYGLRLIRIVVPERYADRAIALAERITRRHVEKVKKDE